MHIFRRDSIFDCEKNELYKLLSQESSSKLLSPPWKKHPPRIAEQSLCSKSLSLTETLRKRAYSNWIHEKKIVSGPLERQSVLHETIGYSLATAPVLQKLLSPFYSIIDQDLERTIIYQKHMIEYLLSVKPQLMPLHNSSPPRRILIAGASGFIGTPLLHLIQFLGHIPIQLVRREPTGQHEIFWDPSRSILPAVEDLGPIDDIICLSGASIGHGRWTRKVKEELVKSRIEPLQMLLFIAQKLPRPLKTFAVASGIGIYGESGNSAIDESYTKTSNLFLGHLAQTIEKYLFEEKAIPMTTRKIALRLAPVIGLQGGMLKKLYYPFKLGLGGFWGSGNEWISWISLEDTLSAILYSIFSPNIDGAVNLSSPQPIMVKEFASTLGNVLKRPTLFSPPLFALYLFFGHELVQNLFLNSQRVVPQKLIDTGFHFHSPSLKDCLRATMGFSKEE